MSAFGRAVVNPLVFGANPTEELPSSPEAIQNRLRQLASGDNVLSNLGYQGMIGKLAPQPLTGGRQTNTPYVPLPEVIIDDPAPAPNPIDKMWWLPQNQGKPRVPGGPAYNVNALNGNTPPLQTDKVGMQYGTLSSGQRAYVSGNGWERAPAGSGVGFRRANPLGIGGFGGFQALGGPYGRR